MPGSPLSATVLRQTASLNRQSGWAGRVPPLIMIVETARRPFRGSEIEALPPGSIVLLRSYDDPDRARLARRLRTLCRDKGLSLAVAGDAALAEQVNADGIHVAERDLGQLPALRRRFPGARLSAAVHSPATLRRAHALGADFCILGAVFPTESHPGRTPLGPVRLARWVRRARLPVYAIGGITQARLPLLKKTGIAGIAAIGLFAEDADASSDAPNARRSSSG